MKHKQIVDISRGTGMHWVGDGFPVNTMFSYQGFVKKISPFLLLDYAGPTEFAPSNTSHGVEQHPHRGFETVTIVYSGEVEHGDNHGNSGKIGPGDVQWMTAARGILHTEMHSTEFTKTGGTLEMVQLWVNLPAKYKMSEPHYKEILKNNIPVVKLPEESGTLRVIAGSFANTAGAAKTFTPVILWDLKLNANSAVDLDIPAGFNCAILSMRGEVKINGTSIVKSAEIAILSQTGDTVTLQANTDCAVLVMGGEPIDEPIVGYGPFVMNTEQEIQQAFADFNAGKF